MLNQQQSAYINDIVVSLLKAKVFSMGAINCGVLYLMVNNGLLYETDVSDVIPLDISYYFLADNVSVPFIPIPNNSSLAIYGIDCMMKERELCLTNQYPLVYHNPDITDDPKFSEIMSSKSSDGSFRYFIPLEGGNTFMYITKNLFNLTKADKCGLNVYDGGSGKKISRFEIFKKKSKKTIYLTFAFLDLIQKGV
jgi:hypothetical protein